MKGLATAGSIFRQHIHNGTEVSAVVFDSNKRIEIDTIPLTDPRLNWTSLITKTELASSGGRRRWRVSPVNYLKLHATGGQQIKGGFCIPLYKEGGLMTFKTNRTGVVANGSLTSPFVRR